MTTNFEDCKAVSDRLANSTNWTTNDKKERFREVLYAIVAVAESGDFMTRGEMAEVLWDVSKDLEDEEYTIKR